MRLNHVTLPATDVETSAEFYRRLGLTQIVASYPKYARFVAEGGVTLSLHVNELPTPSAASIHFEVEDVDRAVAELRDAGFEIETEPTGQPYLWREATLLDPDGNRLFIFHAGEMRQNPPWRLTD
jgi:catechol 2,3-dioxygenase-like lactoylglutathione lyase family enzyme